MWWIVGIVYAGLVLFVLGACRVAGQADELAERQLRELRERDHD